MWEILLAPLKVVLSIVLFPFKLIFTIVAAIGDVALYGEYLNPRKGRYFLSGRLWRERQRMDKRFGEGYGKGFAFGIGLPFFLILLFVFLGAIGVL